MPEGTCLCGAAKVIVTGEPIVHLVCHCGDCRRWTGSVNYGVLYKHDQVTIEGDYVTFNLRKSQVIMRKLSPAPPLPLLMINTVHSKNEKGGSRVGCPRQQFCQGVRCSDLDE